VTEETVADTPLGRVEVEFGFNRWVMVTVASNTGQEQLAASASWRHWPSHPGVS
jgi:hypothetical protein